MLYNILKDQWQTIEIDRIRSITQETDFSQMAELLYSSTPSGPKYLQQFRSHKKSS